MTASAWLPCVWTRGTRYGWAQLPGDHAGGAIAALIALPDGLAMASLMGLPPEPGVFTSILTAPIIALLGRNPVLIGCTASATVPFVAVAERNQGIGGAAKVSIVASVIRMGFCVMAGVTAWMGLCLLDWSAWRRLSKMRRVDATALLATAFAVLTVNALLGVAIGCSCYALRYVYQRSWGAGRVPEPVVNA